MIQKETATVYRGGGRRWFSRRAAYNAEAKRMILARCECDEIGEPGYDWCFYCTGMLVTVGTPDAQDRLDGTEAWKKLRNRLARWLNWRDATAQREARKRGGKV